MTDHQILALVYRLENCELSGSEFHHCEHLAVAVTYLYQCDLEAALEKMRTNLSRFAAHHGSTLYHETITRFWILQAKNHLNLHRCLHDSVEEVVRACSNKNLIFEYYSRELLASTEAKQRWVAPDLRNLAGVQETPCGL